MSEPNEKAKHSSRAKPRGGNKYPFPERLFDLLEDIDARKKPQLAHIISWHPTNGKYFTLHDRDAFEKLIQNNTSTSPSLLPSVVNSTSGALREYTIMRSTEKGRSKLFHQDRYKSTEGRNKEEPNLHQHEQVEEASSPSILASMPNEQDFLVSTFLSNVAEFKLLQNQEVSSVSKVTPEEGEESCMISDISTNEDDDSSWSLFLQELNQKKNQEQPREEIDMSTCYDDDRKMIIQPLYHYDGYAESSESILQQLKSEEEVGGRDESFKNLIDFLSVSDENIIKFLFGNEEEEDHHQEE